MAGADLMAAADLMACDNVFTMRYAVYGML